MSFSSDKKAISHDYHPNDQHLVKAWVVILCASLFFFYEFVQMNMFNTINADLMVAFNTTATHVSNLSAFYFYTEVLFLFPAGIILDRFSTRWIIVTALALCTLATIAFSFSHSFAFAATMRAISGLGASFCLLSAVRLATRWFAPRRLALATGMIVMMAMLGGMMAQTPMSLLIQHVSWRPAVFYDGLMGIVFIAVILWQVRDFPPNSHGKEKNEEVLHELGFWHSIGLALKNGQNWLAGWYTCLLNLPILIIGALWGTEFLIQAHHLTQTQAANVNMMLFLGAIVGSPFMGWYSDRLGKRKPLMILGAIISIILVLIIMYAPDLSYNAWLGLFLLLGFFTSTQIISYPLIAESNANALIGSSTGLAAVIIMSGGAWGQPLFGRLLDLHWNGVKVNDLPIYTLANYHFAWMLLPIMFVVALILAVMIRETSCKVYKGD